MWGLRSARVWRVARSNDFRPEEVVHVQCADQLIALVKHQDLIHLVLFHHVHGLGGQHVTADAARSLSTA